MAYKTYPQNLLPLPLHKVPKVYINTTGSDVYVTLDKPVIHGELILDQHLKKCLDNFIGQAITPSAVNAIESEIQACLCYLMKTGLIETDGETYYIYPEASQLDEDWNASFNYAVSAQPMIAPTSEIFYQKIEYNSKPKVSENINKQLQWEFEEEK